MRANLESRLRSQHQMREVGGRRIESRPKVSVDAVNLLEVARSSDNGRHANRTIRELAGACGASPAPLLRAVVAVRYTAAAAGPGRGPPLSVAHQAEDHRPPDSGGRPSRR